jgi:hypothetical protein
VYLDGFTFGEHQLVGPLGVTAEGTKVPLGVVQVPMENKAQCTGLVADQQDRDLDASKGNLFVVDGAKALDRAIRGVFGGPGPDPKMPSPQGTPSTTCPSPSTPECATSCAKPGPRSPSWPRWPLELLTASLTRKRRGAAASLREGPAEKAFALVVVLTPTAVRAWTDREV